jgi:hypothetical protein
MPLFTPDQYVRWRAMMGGADVRSIRGGDRRYLAAVRRPGGDLAVERVDTFHLLSEECLPQWL